MRCNRCSTQDEKLSGFLKLFIHIYICIGNREQLTSFFYLVVVVEEVLWVIVIGCSLYVRFESSCQATVLRNAK
jgi:hypothetical protein